jgi:hypothetical protein
LAAGWRFLAPLDFRKLGHSHRSGVNHRISGVFDKPDVRSSGEGFSRRFATKSGIVSTTPILVRSSGTEMNLVVFIWQFFVGQWLGLTRALVASRTRGIGRGGNWPTLGVRAGMLWRYAALTGRVLAVEAGSAARIPPVPPGQFAPLHVHAVPMRRRFPPWSNGNWLPMSLVAAVGTRLLACPTDAVDFTGHSSRGLARPASGRRKRVR